MAQPMVPLCRPAMKRLDIADAHRVSVFAHRNLPENVKTQRIFSQRASIDAQETH
jgi:hypothetical protein